MALPLIPLGIGAVALFLLARGKGATSTYSQAPADGSSPAVKEGAAPAKGWQDMPPALQEQVANALGALGVSPSTGELSGGPVSADAIKLATQTAALCESQGFYDVAKELRRLITQAAPKVATPPEATPIKAAAPPGLSAAQIEAIARTLTLDRDPAAIQALIVMLQKLPPSPERDHYIQMAQALLLQLQAAQSTTQTMQQIDQVIKSAGLPQIQQAIQPLPAVVIPIALPTPTLPVLQLPALPAIPSTPSAPSPIPSAAVTPLSLKAATGTRVLKSGATGADVLAWQKILKLDGFTSLVADGKYGPLTVAATKAWQKQRGLTADGVVGPATRAKIGSLPMQVDPTAAAPALPSSAPPPTASAPIASPTGLTLDKFADPSPAARNIKKGDKGEDVKSWQRILKAFGYNLGAYGPNKDGVDGDFGAGVDTATRAFQTAGLTRYRDTRIKPDGVVGPITRRLVLLRTAEAKSVVSGLIRRRRRAA